MVEGEKWGSRVANKKKKPETFYDELSSAGKDERGY